MNNMIIPTRSGVMVDGAGIGEIVNLKTEDKDNKDGIWIYQNFNNADMIAIDVGIDHKMKKGSTFPVYAIYGNKVVTLELGETQISSYYGLWKDKLFACKRKPYILPGDWYGDIT